MAGSLLLLVFTLFSGLVAILVSYYAFRFNRMVGSTLLRFIGLGFALLGAGLLIEASASVWLGKSIVEIFSGPRRYEDIYLLFNIGVQVAAYFVFALGYAVAAYGKNIRAGASAAAVGLAISPAVSQLVLLNYYLFLFSQTAVVLMLTFIVFQGLLIYLRRHNAASLLVLIAFVLIFAAHILMLDSGLNLSPQVYLVATGVQLTGFASLLLFLVKSGRIGSA